MAIKGREIGWRELVGRLRVSRGRLLVGFSCAGKWQVLALDDDDDDDGDTTLA